MLASSGILLILLFLLITFLISAYEKMFNWKNTLDLYGTMYKDVFSPFLIKASILVILSFEVTVSAVIGIALFDIIQIGDFLYGLYALVASGTLLLILLIGLRILKDYSGASQIGVYFLICVLGIFWIQHM